MGLLDKNTSNSPVPGGNLTKPVLIALGALLVGRMFSGTDEHNDLPDNNNDGIIADDRPSGGLGGLLTGVLGTVLGAVTPAPEPSKVDTGGQNYSATAADGASDVDMRGGLGGLLNQLTQAGHEEKVKSWLGNGENAAITPEQLNEAIGSNTISEISQQVGVSKQQLLDELSQALPGIVDQLTVNGQMPSLQQLLNLFGPRS